MKSKFIIPYYKMEKLDSNIDISKENYNILTQVGLPNYVEPPVFLSPLDSPKEVFFQNTFFYLVGILSTSKYTINYLAIKKAKNGNKVYSYWQVKDNSKVKVEVINSSLEKFVAFFQKLHNFRYEKLSLLEKNLLDRTILKKDVDKIYQELEKLDKIAFNTGIWGMVFWEFDCFWDSIINSDDDFIKIDDNFEPQVIVEPFDEKLKKLILNEKDLPF